MRRLTCSRRDLIKGLLAGGGLASFGGLGAFSRLAQAETVPDGKDLHYVFCYFSGGWDILVGLDPRDPREFNNGNIRQTRIQPGYDQLQGTDGRMIETPQGITFGPFIGELARHADKLAVIRGMSMETLTHEAGRRRFLTGKPPSGLLARGSSIATHLAGRLGSTQAIPNLAVTVESYNVDQPNYATALKANGVSDLIRALRPGQPALGTALDRQLDQMLAEVSKCSANEKSRILQSAAGARKKARQMSVSKLDTLFDFGANNAQMAQIRSHYGLPANGGLGTLEAQAALAAQAITGGVSRAVTIQIASGLDTHFQDWTTQQGPRQRQGFNAVARLVEDLERRQYKDTGESWLDHTVIVGFSEFSRTSMLNDRSGRDHSLTAACFVLGAGIKGGRAVGKSSDVGMEPQPINLATGEVDPGGEVPRPEHVMQTLLHGAGLTGDIADLRVPPIAAIMRT